MSGQDSSTASRAATLAAAALPSARVGPTLRQHHSQLQENDQELIVIFDCNPVAWGQIGGGAAHSSILLDVIDQLCTFLNAYTLVSRNNSYHVIAVHPNVCEIIYPHVNDTEQGRTRTAHQALGKPEGSVKEADATLQSKRVRLDAETPSVKREEKDSSSTSSQAKSKSGRGSVSTLPPHPSVFIKQQLLATCLKPTQGLAMRITHESAESSGMADRPSTALASLNSSSLLAAGLARAMCILNKRRIQNPKTMGRILIFQLSSDNVADNLQIMNSVLLAQRLKFLIDTCSLSNEPSLTLQNSAYLTGGYLTHIPVSRYAPVSPTTPSSTGLNPQSDLPLLQHLLMTHLSDPITRKSLSMPTLTSVNLKASCFCHGHVVDTAFVCPSCLGVYCKREIKCNTCGSRFLIHQPRVAGPSAAAAALPLLSPTPTAAGPGRPASSGGVSPATSTKLAPTV